MGRSNCFKGRRRIGKGQFKLGTLCLPDGQAPEIWNAVLAA